VYDIFQDSGLDVFKEEGADMTIGVQPYEFTVKKGVKATCNFVYATVALTVRGSRS
jgi:hypothetical protein